MTDLFDIREITAEQLATLATERFGPDPVNWEFQCPSCEDIARLSDFAAAGADPAVLGSECVGRYLGALDDPEYRGRGCIWTSYDLYSGPWMIDLGDGRVVGSFPLAPGPS